ncbi:glycosyltransferase [Pseudomonas sp. CBSPBW29]|uniref:glycosyltransferase n=1 Tax=Pseudomonas TaxID=286 RepID=UPI0021ABE854|nr:MULTISPECIES: glycosyltransferase [unclassified Pseudomonas]WEL45403.1 glycosyltransferase [Pseudomonas sp. CBSPBW29]WEL66506.1 glycosyltransferase [Pseudomonas sp. CBSPGW29]WEL69993.1 glycosyltransferase [Pseudomonas sp. CBSPCGW29]WEL76947.1 glycosyltransferase [Pseudomonas sp. CBSPAW29]WEL84448.1 glycosyltransferase [Pseudomonas sp. CBSPCAW29]
MKVLKLTPFFHHPDVDSWPAQYDSVGGMQIQTWRQAVWLAEKGIHQHVMTIGFPGLPKLRQLHPLLWVERMLLPMPQLRSEFSGLIGLTQSWALATLCALAQKRRKHDFDIIHAHLDGQIPALLVACLAPRLLQRPLILTVHCSRLAVYTPHSWLDMLQHSLARWLERKAVDTAFSVVALTQRTASLLAPNARNIEIVPDVVDTTQFMPPRPEDLIEFRKRHNLRRQTVGFVGRIAKEKGWQHLIPLAQALREQECELLIVGDGTQSDRLRRAINKAGLHDWVTITGFIPNHKVPVAIAACRLIVMPSMYEEFGGASIEALATGVPVVAFAVGGLSDILRGITPDLLIAPEDTSALIAKVRAVLTGQLAQSIDPARLRAYVEQRYAPSSMGARILNLYRLTRQTTEDSQCR